MVIHCLQWTRIFINCRNHNSTILLSFMIYPGIWLITGFWTHVTRKVPLVEQENINLQFTPSVRGIRAGYTQCSSCSLHTVFVMQLTPSVRGIRAAYTQCSWDSCSLHPVFVVQLTPSVRGIRAAYTQCSSCSLHFSFLCSVIVLSVLRVTSSYYSFAMFADIVYCRNGLLLSYIVFTLQKDVGIAYCVFVFTFQYIGGRNYALVSFIT